MSYHYELGGVSRLRLAVLEVSTNTGGERVCDVVLRFDRRERKTTKFFAFIILTVINS